MHHIQLIHWNAAEAAERAERLRALGYDVACDLPAVPTFLRALAHDPPAAVVIDLSRQQVRAAGLAARLVDYKICAVDDTWSALLFRRRKVKSEVGTPGPVSASNL